jgi:hypothetical protein
VQTSAGDLVVNGNICYTSLTDSLYIFDCQDPSNPQRVRALPGTGGYLALEGNRLYALSFLGLDIYNITDPINLTHLGRTTLGEGVFSVQDGVVYKLDEHGWLSIWDYKNSQNPNRLGSVISGGYHLAVSGDYAYLVDSSGLTVVRVR